MLKSLALLIFFAIAQASELSIAVSKNVGELNPHLYSPNEMFAQDMVYEGLVKFGEDGKIHPLLAKSWNVSEDGRFYNFTLREDVNFSNGEKFDAAAAKANFDAILANRKRHAWLESANLIRNVVVTDKFGIQIELEHAYNAMLKELSLIRPFRFIAPSSMIEGGTKDGIKAPVGTGAWKLVKSERGVYDRFEINENFRGRKPVLQAVTAKIIPEPAIKVIALKTGEIDMIYGGEQVGEQISFDTFNELKKQFDSSISKPLFTLVLALNSNKFPTDSLAVRKALNSAVDKDLIVKEVFFDTQPKADFLFDKNFENTDVNVSEYKFDIAAANKILDDDGWIKDEKNIRYKDGKALKFELVYVGANAVQKSIAEILQSEFLKIGAIVELKADESSIFYKRQRSGDFGAIFNSTWGAPYDPQGFLASMRLPAHADYQAQLGLKDKAEIDKKISEILKTTDENLRRKLTRETLVKLHEEAIYIPITYETNKALYNKKVKNVKMSIIKNHIPFDEMSVR